MTYPLEGAKVKEIGDNVKLQNTDNNSVISLTEYIFKSAAKQSGSMFCDDENCFTDEEIDKAVDRCLREKILPKNRIALKRKFGI